MSIDPLSQRTPLRGFGGPLGTGGKLSDPYARSCM